MAGWGASSPAASDAGKGWGGGDNATATADAGNGWGGNDGGVGLDNSGGWGATGGTGGDENAAINMNAMACHNCGVTGHMSRECLEPRKMTGECFNCGEVGHNKADCTNPKVDRPFTGDCRLCGKQGHPASACPDKPAVICRICLEEGHRAMECTSARKDVFRADLPDMTADAAWEAMKTADKFRDIDDFKEAFLCYAKVLFNQGVPVDIADVEKGFREENRNIYLIAKEREVPANMTIVNMAGKIDQKYVLSFMLSEKPLRKKWAQGWPENPAQNLERLAEAGFVMDRLVPLCDNCGELGHVKKHCKEERVELENKVEVSCVICKETGHRARDCTNERIDPFACRNCKQSGHKAEDCTEPRSAEGVECKRCNEIGHFAKDCPTGGGPRTCRNCNQEGHIAKDCTEPRNPANMQCRNCDEMGHSSRECPKPRDYSKVQCKNCNEFGHTVVRCKAPKPEGDSSNAAGGGDGWGNDAGTTKPTNGDEEWIKGEPAGNNW